ncbi:efflux RND transporter periplasmic adaptor subunit [Vibrio tapetis subsp. quintayensis]|uniref:efflux RND transporter periplasmic adaptor subunit n=1 Tax=Vibrio tapetis TaxID=52443 RepID=UPI0025B48751|nr:efflux RND transporter periplasmic adaptor subunit [Vibrio tapetis]MDN3679116.1 efflux RND transporter periplasmic adaptor subunit [Vibrio tapetis subsp. quintayensis]
MITSNNHLAKLTSLAAIAALSLSLSGCNNANSEIIDPVITPVKLVTVPQLGVQTVDSFLAKVDATERAQLSFQVGGVIESHTVRMGEQVKKGQVIAKLDPTDYQLAVDAKQAEYDLAKTQYQRAKQLFDKKLISADNYDQNETRFKANLANLEQAKTDLAHTALLAPFDGMVSYTYAKQFQLVGAKQPVINLINIDQMDVAFTLPVSYVKTVGIDALKEKRIWITMDNHSQQRIEASFNQISTQPDLDTNSYEASVTIKRPKAMNLLTGMSGQVHIQSATRHGAFALPNAAWLSKLETKGELWRFDPDSQQVNRISVQFDDNNSVIAGLEKGDLIVVAGVEKLIEGQIVKAWKKEGGI